MNKKQSLILGALTSSAGIFVTKLLGIFYMIPFTALAGEHNLTFYSYAYGVYEILLNISLAGLPYAIATMVAKYHLKEDYKSIVFIQKLSTSIMLGFGIVAAGIMFFGSLPIARYITPNDITPEGLVKARTVIQIIALAFFTVPLLSGTRGIFQGLKDLKIYATSQVLEQFSRITFLLTVGFIAVSIFKQDGIWAVYGAIASAFVSSFIALIHLLVSRRKQLKSIHDLADQQQTETVEPKVLFKELLWFAIPYLITTFLGNSLNIVNTTFFSSAMDLAGYSADMTSLLYSMIMLTTSKLTSIPHFLATGFSIAIIPYLTTCYEQKDFKMVKKYILDAIDSVLYLGLPLCFYLFAIGTEIYYVMYGAQTSFELGGEVLKWATLSAILGTVSPVINSLTMAVRLRKSNIIFMTIGFMVKFISFFPLIYFFGYSGAITSSALCSITIISLDLWKINKIYHISYKKTFYKLLVMLVGLAGMYMVFVGLKRIGLSVVDQPRILALIELGFYGLGGLLAYVGITSALRLPEHIFHIEGNMSVWEYGYRFVKSKIKR